MLRRAEILWLALAISLTACPGWSVSEEIRDHWERGDLRYKLRPYQARVYDFLWDQILDEDADTAAYIASRQQGKTFITRAIACEVAIRCPGESVNIGAPVGKEMRKINRTVMRDILRDCPEDLKPRYNRSDGTYEFPNGSHVFTAGLNNGHEDDQRGNNAILNILDEAGFIDQLDYCLVDVYGPQTDTRGGTTLLCSTPPKTPAHELKSIFDDLEQYARVITVDIHQTEATEADKARIMRRCGGELSTSWRREYLCLFIVDSELQVIPEWSDVYVRGIERTELFAFWHKYSAMDLGVRDFNATLFAYYDFAAATLVIEDEWIARGPEVTTDKIINRVIEREEALGYKPMRLRIADNNNVQLLVDLAMDGLPFVATSKEELPAMMNTLRLWIDEGRVIVHPRCQNLIGCLKNAIWKDSKDGRWIGRELARAKAYGHFDALMALVYLVRNVDVVSNPVPRYYGIDRSKQYVSPRFDRQIDERTEQLQKVFGPKRRLA